MDPSVHDDDDCFSVQLEGSDKSPKASQTILRQIFPMRRYNLGQDGRLTNLVKAMDSNQRVDNSIVHAATSASCSSADTIVHSIAAILQPHTSSPSLPIIARALASLMTADSSACGNGLDMVLSAHLDSLAFSPQAKQVIIPVLLGIAKFTEVQTNVARSQGIEPLGNHSGAATATPSDGAHAYYQVHQRPFSSSSGSGYTIWYFSKSSSSIQSPPVVSQSKTGHLYVHFDSSTKTYQYWMFGVSGQWEPVSKNAQNPLNHDRVLSIRTNGEPSWVTRATTSTTETRRDKRARSVAG